MIKGLSLCFMYYNQNVKHLLDFPLTTVCYWIIKLNNTYILLDHLISNAAFSTFMRWELDARIQCTELSAVIKKQKEVGIGESVNSMHS